MVGVTEWLALIVALLGVPSSGVIGYLVYALTSQSQRAEIQRQVGFLYDKLMDFRAEHPEVLVLARNWNEACFAAIYRQTSEEDKRWALYLTYAELCCGFSNVVLYGDSLRLLGKRAYEKQYEPLVRLILTEHYPYIASAVQGPYLSTFIKDFVIDAERKGWDWQQRHKMLPGP
jgi:hypothetical protein